MLKAAGFTGGTKDATATAYLNDNKTDNIRNIKCHSKNSLGPDITFQKKGKEDCNCVYKNNNKKRIQKCKSQCMNKRRIIRQKFNIVF